MKIFLSYARADREIADQVYEELTSQRHDVFFDRNIEGGENWPDRIGAELDASEAFVPILSANAPKSRYFLIEIGRALQRMRTKPNFIFPVSFDAAVVGVPELDSTQTIDLRDGRRGYAQLFSTLLRRRPVRRRLGKKVAPLVEVIRPPKSRGSIRCTLRFRGGSPVEDVDVLGALEAWPKSGRPLLAMVSRFSADVRQVLHVVGGKLTRGAEPYEVAWIRGAPLLGVHRSAARGRSKQSLASARILLIDFSDLDLLELGRAVGDAAASLRSLAVAWQRQQRRVVFGLPLFLRGILRDLEAQPNRLLVFEDSEVHRAHRPVDAEACRLGTKLAGVPDGVVARALSCSSDTLREAVEEYVRLQSRRPEWSLDPVMPNGIAAIAELAGHLFRQRFYEPAYRLEMICRTAFAVADHIPLEADLERAHPGDSSTTPGVVEVVEDINLTPAVAPRATLIGEAGAGKTSSLLRLALHLAAGGGHEAPRFVPVIVDLKTTSSRLLDSMLRAGMEAGARLRLGSSIVDLECHRQLAQVSSLAELMQTFASPLYLMIDCIELLSYDTQRNLEDELCALEEHGFMLAVREGRLLAFGNIPQLRLRRLRQSQVERLLRTGNMLADREGLFGSPVTPIARHSRNPFVLRLILDTAVETRQVVSWTLDALIERHVDRSLHAVVRSARLVSSVKEKLSDAALDARRDPFRAAEITQPVDPFMVAEKARLISCTADRRQLWFGHELLLDFFAARRAADDVRSMGDEEWRHCYAWLTRTDPRQNDTLLWFLTGLLARHGETRSLDRLLRDLASVAPKVALQCLLALPDETTRDRPVRSVVVDEIVSEALTAPFQARIAQLDALGFLDPRLPRPDRLPDVVAIDGGPDSISIGKYPVTNLEYQRYVRATKAPRAPFAEHPDLNAPNMPVVGVTWLEARNFCAWLTECQPDVSIDLPSTREWDLAAYGPGTLHDLVSLLRRVPLQEAGALDWPDRLLELGSSLLDEHADQLREERRTPVGSFVPTRSGCYDLVGGVWEWCSTWVSPIDAGNATDKGSGPASVLVKGGVWSGGDRSLWTLLGTGLSPHVRSDQVGFRICCRPRGTRSTADREDTGG